MLLLLLSVCDIFLHMSVESGVGKIIIESEESEITLMRMQDCVQDNKRMGHRSQLRQHSGMK